MGYVPLGGDGFTAPFAAYTVDRFQVGGAAGGGTARLTVTMDPKFCALIQYATWSINQATGAAAEFKLRITALQQSIPLLIDQGSVTNITATISGSEQVARTWEPTPVILPGSGGVAPFLEATWSNIDVNEYFLSLQVFLFNIRVRELTPMGPLLWARGST